MKILFISHEGSMTGAPLYLLNLCRYFKSHTNWEMCFLLRKDGPLREEFSQLGDTFVYHERPVHNSSTPIATKVTTRIKRFSFVKKLRYNLLKSALKRENLNLIYANTIVNGDVLQFLADLRIKTITHVHELENVIMSYGLHNLEQVKLNSSFYITSSPSVLNNLINNIGISADKVLDTNPFPIHSKTTTVAVSTTKLSLGIPPASFVIGTAGTVEWRKGWDLFIQLANDFNKIDTEGKPTYFVWVGSISQKIKDEVEQVLALSDINLNVIFTGHSNQPLKYFSMFDVFCLMSREEAFGIVALEAALYKMPILCFKEGAEGLAAFVKDDAGLVISDFNTFEMAAKLLALRDDIDSRKRMGEAAYTRVNQDYSLLTQAEKIKNHIHSIVEAD